VTYWAAPAKLKQPGMTADPSIALKSMPVIVAPDLTVEQAAFPAMCLAVLAKSFNGVPSMQLQWQLKLLY
jgi:hypothetical protein